VLATLSRLGAATSPAAATFEDVFLTRLREQKEAKHEDEGAS
jgi:hypothetical protein